MTVFPVKTSLFKHTGFSCSNLLGVETKAHIQNCRYAETSYRKMYKDVVAGPGSFYVKKGQKGRRREIAATLPALPNPASARSAGMWEARVCSFPQFPTPPGSLPPLLSQPGNIWVHPVVGTKQLEYFCRRVLTHGSGPQSWGCPKPCHAAPEQRARRQRGCPWNSSPATTIYRAAD